MSQQSFISWIRQPASIILIIALAIMFLMLTDQAQLQEGMGSGQAGKISSMPPVTAPSVTTPLAGEMPQILGGELPRIVQRLGSPAPGATAPGSTVGAKPDGRLTAPDLGSLLGRLEDKVKAEPNNVSNRLLLAQTYNELGLADKALDEVRAAIKQFPDPVNRWHRWKS